MLVLIWIIVFKLQLGIDSMVRVRRINLIPFYPGIVVGNHFRFYEIIGNVLIFIPFGIYLCMIKKSWGIISKFLIIVGTSFIFEASQYLLSVGISDITDIITNTVGGIIGIIIYYIPAKISKNEEKTSEAFTTLAAITSVLLALILLILFFYS